MRRHIVSAGAALLLLAAPVAAFSSEPKWSVTQDPNTRTFVLSVDAQDLASDERVVKARCRIDYLDANGKRLKEMVHDVEVPIRAGFVKKQSVPFGIKGASGVSGVMMEWSVVVVGGTMDRNGNVRNGSTPPEGGE